MGFCTILAARQRNVFLEKFCFRFSRSPKAIKGNEQG